MPSIPQMGSVWDDWGKTEAAIIKGADPASSWTTMATSIQGKIK
jgi:arabinogalactan oligomer/maltooligosaccharide transport system substrate-binding protein